jgi:bacillithiol synthase
LADSARHYGVPDATLHSLTALAEGRAVMVVTGQQVGYLGGPLFTFLKAYHTTRLAARLEKDLACPVIPLFWLEGEDHDLDEVRDARFVNQTGELQTVRFTPERDAANFEVGRYAVHGDADLRALAEAVDAPDAEALALLQAAYTHGTLSDGIGTLLARILGPRGLLVVEGMDERLKRMALPLWERILEQGPRLTEILLERGTELRAGGYNAPLSPTPDAYLFYLTGDDHRRAPVTYDGRIRHADGATEHISAPDLAARIRNRPQDVSPKAALRPLYQDWVLPTIAYVAGPGEMDYHAQLAPFYRELNVCAPAVFPRLSATIMDSRIARLLQKSGLDPADILTVDKATLMKRYLHGQDEGRTQQLFAQSRADIEAVFEKIKQELAAIDPTLAGAAAASAGKILHPLDQLREKADKALKQKHALALSRLEKLLAVLKPQDKLPERDLCTGYFLLKYGTERLLAALDELPEITASHPLITMDDHKTETTIS